MNKPYVLYLDQNKWIDLARGVAKPDVFVDFRRKYDEILGHVLDEKLIVPLTQTNIHETLKINDPARRELLARTQARISRGWVFRSLSAVLKVQLREFISKFSSLAFSSPDEKWFLSKYFFEAAADYNPVSFGFEIPQHILHMIESNPEFALFDYLTNLDDGHRKEAVRLYSGNTKELISGILKRRELLRNEPISFRSKVYSAQLVADRLDEINNLLDSLSIQKLNDEGNRQKFVLTMAKEVASFAIECALVIKTNGEDRIVDENDLRDVYSLTIAIPYSDAIVAEKAVLARARQAKLDRTYNTEFHTSILKWNILEKF